MMKSLASTILLALAPAAFAANSLIRVDCMEGTAGAQVSINGKYQFTCADFQKEPISLRPGDYTVTAVQPVSKEYERVFTQDISLQPGVPKRIRVVLPEKTLTAFGKAEEARRKEQTQREAEAEKQRQLMEAVSRDITDASAGDPDAMKRLAERYRTGDGVEQDSEKASQWLQAAENRVREQKIADLKQALANKPYFPMAKNFKEMLSERKPSELITIAPSAPFLTLGGLLGTAADVTSMPTTAAKRKKIQEQLDQLETHAARWANPDSMVAKAYGARRAAD